jgi:O-antigen/teichoic acid export membrane protein
VSDRDVRGLARGSALSLVLSVCAQGCTIGVTVVLARRLGAADVGRYAQAQAVLALLGILTLGGLKAGLTRFVATQRAAGDMGAVHGTVRAGMGFAVIASVLCGGVLAVLAQPLAVHAFHDPGLTGPLQLVAVTLPFASATDAAMAASQGYRRMRTYAVVQLFLEPTLRIVLTALLVVLGYGVRGALVALLISNVVACSIALVAVARQLGPATAPIRYTVRRLFSFSVISWFASLATTGLIWADTVLLGLLAKNTDVGVYNVATRLVMLAAFVMVPINQAVGPRIAHASQLDDRGALGQLYRVATSWIVRLSLPAFIVLFAFPKELLHFFGRGFVIGASVTVVFAVGKLVDAATGPCAVMLNMSGRPLHNMLTNVLALALNIGLNLYLIPRHGVLGAAIAWSVSLIVANVVRVLAVRHLYGLLPFNRATAQGLMAGAAALGVALALRPVVGALPALAAAMATYLGAVLLAMSADDRDTFRSLVRRSPPPRPVTPVPPLQALRRVTRGCGLLRPHPAHEFDLAHASCRCPGIEARTVSPVYERRRS